MAYGTLSSLDTLAASQQSVADYGEDKAFGQVQMALDAHNAIVQSMTSDFIETTTDNQRRYGGAASGSMDEVDEFGRGDAQKVTAGVTVGFPLRLFDYTVQWTKKYMENTTGAEFVAQLAAARVAHVQRIQREVKRALFKPTNATFTDRLVKNVSLQLRALINADSAAMPVGPNGEVFDPTTHNHYLARVGGSLAASDISATLETVIEHHNQGGARLYINRAQEAAVRAMTTNFSPYMDGRVIPATTTQVANGQLNQTNLYNRAIGVFDGAEVWVKPWVPAGYMFAFVTGADKPLVMRERKQGSSALTIAAQDENHPLRAQTVEAEFGVGVWTRTNGAVLYTGGTTYVTPTFP